MSISPLPSSSSSVLTTLAPVVCSRVLPRPAFTLCSKAIKGQSYEGWLCAEKLDGVRAMWGRGRFQSRYGLTFRPPPWFTAALDRHLGPDIFLDGELWMGRHTFSEAAGILRRQRCQQGWAKVQYHIYDLASQETAHLPYEERFELLKHLLQPIGVHSVGKSSANLATDSDIAGICEEMVRAGGEGLILRDPQGKYLSDKRNPGIVKVKLHDDSEALVIGHLTYQGRGSDRGISSLVVVDRDRTIFKLGSGLTDEIRRDPPPVGTVIQYKYSEISALTGRPRFPVYLRERVDMSKERFLEEMRRPDLSEGSTCGEDEERG
ncbi:DNA ligase, putative [Perkinsus marinus ATCC 50983]|uniref:DNA ligase, putative n=1 Tax=Perkinsus marinus (strain ATCC 50983 / TXsc) TaxID=423536 RepID=C5KL83_PERM5|nr:DNA ligase, putative [Perkinsus marinus ATCC 50983]EER14756.1 DNA ligase, putative [Perkinsus marinus ATCC 50983]|eukprot:XP_002782960.1 DNA ligase, putative [Perkinsus marinus ATCC 50983]